MGLTTSPFPYQDEAINQTLELGYGLIGFDMGLGKTICGIAIVEDLLAAPEINFAMIVVPSGLRYQWAESISRFTDVDTTTKTVNKQSFTIPTAQWCVVIDGPPKDRNLQYDYISNNWPNYVIVSYDQVVNDWKQISKLRPELVIIDEASYIKGFKAQRSKRVKQLGKQAEFTVALTGTPIENRLEELFSVMQFVDPSYLGTFESFENKFIVRDGYGRVQRYKNLDILHKKMAKVMTRKTRLDPDVAPFMPDVDFRDEYLFLTKSSQKLYDEIAKEILEESAKVDATMSSFDMTAYYNGSDDQDMSAQGRIMARALALQMLCDHPDLLRSSALKYIESEGEQGSKYAFELLDAGRLGNLGPSEKMLKVINDVKNALEFNKDTKIIIFSFFKEMGRFLQDALEDYGSVLYNGDMSAGKKMAAKTQFQTDPDCRLFIASDAGAFGVDLPQANILINYDEVDSAGKMDQRNARHVRAGSKHSKVFVISYMVDGSLEEYRHARLAYKRRISAATVDGVITSSDGTLENDLEGMMSFLEGNLPE